MAKKKKYGKNAREHKQDSLVEQGQKFLLFTRKHAVLVIAAVLLVVAAVVFVFKSLYDIQARESKAGSEMWSLIEEIEKSRSAPAVEAVLTQLQALRDENKDSKIYPELTFNYGRICLDMGIRYDNDEFLAHAEDALSELLEKYPDSDVAKLKDPGTGENLPALLLEQVRKSRTEMSSPEMETLFDPDGLYTPPTPADGPGPGPIPGPVGGE